MGIWEPLGSRKTQNEPTDTERLRHRTEKDKKETERETERQSALRMTKWDDVGRTALSLHNSDMTVSQFAAFEQHDTTHRDDAAKRLNRMIPKRHIICDENREDEEEPNGDTRQRRSGREDSQTRISTSFTII
jgi:hypothetical protein